MVLPYIIVLATVVKLDASPLMSISVPRRFGHQALGTLESFKEHASTQGLNNALSDANKLKPTARRGVSSSSYCRPGFSFASVMVPFAH